MIALVPQQKVEFFLFLTCISELFDWNLVPGGCKINRSFLYHEGMMVVGYF